MNRETFRKIFTEILPALGRMGVNNPRVSERQTLYGDILDWLRDYHGELRNKEHEDDFVAKLIIGEYVTMNKLL